MFRTRSLFVFILVTMAAALAAGNASSKHSGWADGPVRWLMTDEDRAAWSSISTDAAASEFIDLFWARRDPTPGTAANEYKDAFDKRVTEADKLFADSIRGALTDWGRVYIVLGPPTKMNVPTRHRNGTPSPIEITTNSFVYSDPASKDRPTTIKFVQDAGTGQFNIDPGRSNIYGTLETAVTRAIVSPDLKTLPAWAQRW